MKPKIVTRKTTKGGRVRTLTLGNQTVNIYTTTKKVTKKVRGRLSHRRRRSGLVAGDYNWLAWP